MRRDRANVVAAAAVVLLLASSSSTSALKMTQDVYEAFGDRGGTAELVCKADELPDQCKFTRPNGQVVCTKSNEEYNYYAEDCVEDDAVKLAKDMEQCRLVITGLDPAVHYGEWTCAIEAWNSKAEAKVVLKPDQPKVVEFLNVYKDTVVNIGKAQDFEFSCGVYSPKDKLKALKTNPGEMVWKLGSKTLARSSEYQKDVNKNFIQKIQIPLSLRDDKAKLSCSLKSGSSDVVALNVVHLEWISDEADETVEEGSDELVIEREFIAFPAPKKTRVFWEVKLRSKQNKVRVFAEKSSDPFTAGPIKSLGGNKYSVSLTIAEPDKLAPDFEDMRISVKIGQDPLTDYIEMPIGLVFPVPAVREVAPTTPDPTVVITEKKEGNSSSASIYIIVAIIALVIALCAVFYCCKRGDQETATPLPAPVRTIKDTEEGKPFLGKEENQATPFGQEDGAKSASDAEKNLLDKLNPTKPERTYNPDSKAKKEKFAQKAGANTTKVEDEHQEISNMADTIRILDEMSSHSGSPDPSDSVKFAF